MPYNFEFPVLMPTVQSFSQWIWFTLVTAGWMTRDLYASSSLCCFVPLLEAQTLPFTNDCELIPGSVVQFFGYISADRAQGYLCLCLHEVTSVLHRDSLICWTACILRVNLITADSRKWLLAEHRCRFHRGDKPRRSLDGDPTSVGTRHKEQWSWPLVLRTCCPALQSQHTKLSKFRFTGIENRSYCQCSQWKLLYPVKEQICLYVLCMQYYYQAWVWRYISKGRLITFISRFQTITVESTVWKNLKLCT